MIMQATWEILLLGQVFKNPKKNELVDVAKENAEICNITRMKPR